MKVHFQRHEQIKADHHFIKTKKKKKVQKLKPSHKTCLSLEAKQKGKTHLSSINSTKTYYIFFEQQLYFCAKYTVGGTNLHTNKEIDM